MNSESRSLFRRLFALPLHWQILIALAAAVLVGLSAGQSTSLFGITLLSVLVFVGTLFLQALKMLIVPLVVSSIIVGMMEINPAMLGRLGSKTLLYYAISSLVAILVGLMMVNLLQPGIADGEPVRDMIGLSADTSSVLAQVDGRGAGDLANVFIRMVPANIVSAAANGQMLGLIFFSLLFGYFITRLDQPQSTTQKQF
jgi:Na+/H+-dicarboxylate symporter